MTPERTGAQVIDLTRERRRLMEARRQREQRALVEVIRELRLQDRNCAPEDCQTQPPDDPEPSPGGDAA